MDRPSPRVFSVCSCWWLVWVTWPGQGEGSSRAAPGCRAGVPRGGGSRAEGSWPAAPGSALLSWPLPMGLDGGQRGPGCAIRTITPSTGVWRPRGACGCCRGCTSVTQLRRERGAGRSGGEGLSRKARAPVRPAASPPGQGCRGHMVFSIFKRRQFRGSVSPVPLAVVPGCSRRQVCWGVFAPQKQMKFLEQQQDETKQAREEARRLRSKMQTMERCAGCPPCPCPGGHSSQDCVGVGSPLWL